MCSQVSSNDLKTSSRDRTGKGAKEKGRKKATRERGAREGERERGCQRALSCWWHYQAKYAGIQFFFEGQYLPHILYTYTGL